MAGNRPDFDRKRVDDPTRWDWWRTRTYLVSIGYFALKAGCKEDEVLWYLVQFLETHSPDFSLTPQQRAMILKLAKGY